MPFTQLYVPAVVSAVTDDEAWFQAMLDAEAALARAEDAVGILPTGVADEIAGRCDVRYFDLTAITLEARNSGNPAEPLVRALRLQLRAETANYVHLGATSQDIVDSAAMLVTKRCLLIIEPQLSDLADRLASLARQHRDTLMVGRTLLQQAVPITFGFKVAGWLEAVTRARESLSRLHAESLTAQLGGACGTLAPLGDAGMAVLSRYCRLLALAEPVLAWHTERSRMGEVGAALARTASAMDKIALDVLLLSQTEVAEVEEGGSGGGSSTMPHKHNPVGSVLTRACARQVEAAAGLLAGGAAYEHERSAGAWQGEWPALSAALRYTGGAVYSMSAAVDGLRVNTARMLANLSSSQGLVMAERLALLLAGRVGRPEAHRMVRDASEDVAEGKGSLGEVLMRDDRTGQVMAPSEIRDAMNPQTYLGSCGSFIDRGLSHHDAVNGDSHRS